MPRNGSGTYSLPSGNPVVSGAVIASTWANNTLTDIATAITGSLSRDGQAAMTGPLPMGANDIQNAGNVTGSGTFSAGNLTLTSTSLPANGLYLPGANTVGFSTASTARGSINGSGAWSIPASTAGATLTATGNATNGALNLFQGADNTVVYLSRYIDGTNNPYLSIIHSNSGLYSRIDANGSTSAACVLQLATLNVPRVTLNNVGQMTLATPTSGSASLTINQVSSGYGMSVVAGVNDPAYVALTDGQTGNRVWRVGSGVGSAGTFGIYDSTGAALRFSINTTGNATFAAPTSGIALTVNGVSGTHALSFMDSGAVLQQAGFLGCPQNLQNATYTLVLSDAGKNIHKSSGVAHTDTIPANSSVAFPVGTTINFTVINGASALTIACGDTLIWAPSAGTGSRTLAAAGMATAIKVATTTWMISGVGLT